MVCARYEEGPMHGRPLRFRGLHGKLHGWNILNIIRGEVRRDEAKATDTPVKWQWIMTANMSGRSGLVYVLHVTRATEALFTNSDSMHNFVSSSHAGSLQSTSPSMKRRLNHRITTKV
jgi:hypothetical protein